MKDIDTDLIIGILERIADALEYFVQQDKQQKGIKE